MNVYAHHHLDPETTAMLQALYSRSPRSVTDHLVDVAEKGPEKFMSQFYVGYGHKSIGDCGTTTLFVEDVSMLAAKALQDSPLYNGQEASTRYMDMSSRPFLNPANTQLGEDIQGVWRSLYTDTYRELVDHLTSHYPCQLGENPKVWEKAIKARAFDIARGLLPAGATTNVSWHTTLSHAHEHLSLLKHHPLTEIQQMASGMLEVLSGKYPSSFSHETDPKVEEFVGHTYWPYPAKLPESWGVGDVENVDTRLFDLGAAKRGSPLWKNRPGRAFLSREVQTWGRIAFRVQLDFGSFRDLQRHRSCLLEMPLLTISRFHPWYLANIPQAGNIAAAIERAIGYVREIEDPVVRQYCLPMGYMVDTTIHCDLRSAVYIAKLRSGQSVHPTLRKVAQGIGHWLDSHFDNISKADYSPDTWSVRRGVHDIVQEEAGK